MHVLVYEDVKRALRAEVLARVTDVEIFRPLLRVDLAVPYILLVILFPYYWRCLHYKFRIVRHSRFDFKNYSQWLEKI